VASTVLASDRPQAAHVLRLTLAVPRSAASVGVKTFTVASSTYAHLGEAIL